MANDDCRNAITDCAEVEGLFESAQVLIANANKLKAWINGDKDAKVELGGELQPTLRGIIDAVDQLAGIATPEHLGAIKPDNLTTTVDAVGNLSALGGNLLLNSEEWITESGEWEAPVTGWYSLLLFSGGYSGHVVTNSKAAAGGPSGCIADILVYLSKGQQVPVTIGAGGVSTGANTNFVKGGVTSFGDFSATRSTGYSECNGEFSPLGMASGISIYYGFGAGYGGGYPSVTYDNISQEERNTKCSAIGHHGAGGGASIMSSGIYGIGPGAPGSIRVRWYDFAKANGPVPEPALLSARRMAPRAAAAPVTVNLYDPETGQGSVWREEDAEAKLAEGLITEEAWLEICAAKRAEEYAAWLVDPETEVERFAMLRAARDAKLAATDYLVAPDYPITAEQKAAVMEYRQELRDLPAEEGAPWDGGGEDTPWPAMPVIEKAE